MNWPNTLNSNCDILLSLIFFIYLKQTLYKCYPEIDILAQHMVKETFLHDLRFVVFRALCEIFRMFMWKLILEEITTIWLQLKRECT